MADRRLDFVRMGYLEYVELYDAYDADVCQAQVGETDDLAVARLAARAPASRILSEPLKTFPVFAATPAIDPQWSAIVAWGGLHASARRAAGDALVCERPRLPPHRRRGARPRLRLAGPRHRRRRNLRRHVRSQSRRSVEAQIAARRERPGRSRRVVRHALSGIGDRGVPLLLRPAEGRSRSPGPRQILKFELQTAETPRATSNVGRGTSR